MKTRRITIEPGTSLNPWNIIYIEGFTQVESHYRQLPNLTPDDIQFLCGAERFKLKPISPSEHVLTEPRKEWYTPEEVDAICKENKPTQS